MSADKLNTPRRLLKAIAQADERVAFLEADLWNAREFRRVLKRELKRLTAKQKKATK